MEWKLSHTGPGSLPIHSTLYSCVYCPARGYPFGALLAYQNAAHISPGVRLKNRPWESMRRDRYITGLEIWMLFTIRYVAAGGRRTRALCPFALNWPDRWQWLLYLQHFCRMSDRGGNGIDARLQGCYFWDRSGLYGQPIRRVLIYFDWQNGWNRADRPFVTYRFIVQCVCTVEASSIQHCRLSAVVYWSMHSITSFKLTFEI